jgi:hypothetical protein
VLLRVASARHVEAVDLAGGGDIGGVEVEAGEQRYHREALHRLAEVAADHRRKSVGLAFERELGAFDLLVVLEFDLVQPHDLDGQAGRARDADQGVVVTGEHLLDVTLGDQVSGGRAAVTSHHDTTGEGSGNDRRAVGY